MTDDADAGNAKERSAAVFRIVEAASEPAERTARQQRSHHSGKRSIQFFFEKPLNGVDQPFAGLERDIAGKAVANYDVGIALVHLARFDVADEIQRRRFQKPMGIANQLVALAFLFADRQQADARALHAERHLRVDRSHRRKLQKMLRATIRVRPDVEQNAKAIARGYGRRESRAVDSTTVPPRTTSGFAIPDA